jgi:hypothetical protein
LQDLGYKADAKDNVIKSSSNGLDFIVYVSDSGWLQIGLAVNNTWNFTLDDANSFNNLYRLGKVFLDEGHVYLTSDFKLARPSIEDSFAECIPLWDNVVGTFLRTLQEKRHEPTHTESHTAIDDATSQ